MITADRIDRSCILDSSKLSTEGDVSVVEDGYRSTLKASSVSPVTEVDRTEGSSVSETLELRLRAPPPVLTTVTTTAVFLFT